VKFLMLYVNDTSNTKVPLGILYILSQLKKNGHEVSIFDNSKYGLELEINDHTIRGHLLNFQLLDLEPYGVTYEKVTKEYVDQELSRQIEAFRPDIIGISITEDTSNTGLHFAEVCKETRPDIPVIMGGVFCMTRPDRVIANKAVDMVCIGEGENAVRDLIDRMSKGESILGINNLWIKLPTGEIKKNPIGPPSDLETLPYPDLSLVDDRHLFAPFAGHVYKMTYVESQRGCPRRCTYCCNQIFLDTYSEYAAQYLRRKSVPRLIDEIEYLKNEYDLTFIQFTDDDFLLRPLKEIALFSELYKKRVGLPFWIQAEARNATDDKIRLIREAGCISISMGIETGSEFIRKKVMKRKTSRESTIKAFQVMHKYGIRTSGNMIVGVPEETRDTIFETIELVRLLEPRSINSNIFIPYYGVAMRDYAVNKGYLDDSYHRDLKDSWRAVLDMPQISKKEVEDLARTFVLYSTLPKGMWPEIEKVEKYPEENVDILKKLEKMFWDIMLERGINVDVPGIDYDGMLRKRQKELELRKAEQ
jgi:anaerobic magnesium-protoporphyrin IX monomethyl ester cyclase